MSKIIEKLIDSQLDHRKASDTTDTLIIKCYIDNNDSQTQIKANSSTFDLDERLVRDINIPAKTRCDISTKSTNFQFIGPDKATSSISSISQYLRINKTIMQLGLQITDRLEVCVKIWFKHKSFEKNAYMTIQTKNWFNIRSMVFLYN